MEKIGNIIYTIYYTEFTYIWNLWWAWREGGCQTDGKPRQIILSLVLVYTTITGLSTTARVPWTLCII